jgi:restriction system protein
MARKSDPIGFLSVIIFLFLLSQHGWNGVILVSGIGLFIFIIYKIVLWKQNDVRLRAIKMENIDVMDGWSFETYIAKLLEYKGYNTNVTKGSNDLGVDIIAKGYGKKYAIQVKRQSKYISRRAVSDAVAGMNYYNCNAAMVIANNYYSQSAIELARSNRVELIDRDTLADWIVEFKK